MRWLKCIVPFIVGNKLLHLDQVYPHLVWKKIPLPLWPRDAVANMVYNINPDSINLSNLDK